MGFFDSSSSSKADQTTQTGEGSASGGIGAKGNTSVSLNNIKGKPKVEIVSTGIGGAELTDLLSDVYANAAAISGKAVDAAGSLANQASADVGAIATSASGAQSEIGRNLNKFITPALLAFIAWLWLRKRK